jgi:hypothetical protein
MSLTLPKRGAISMQFTINGLTEIDSNNQLFQVSGKVVFTAPPNPSTYRGIFDRCHVSNEGKISNGLVGGFCFKALENQSLEIEFKTTPINLSDVFEFISWLTYVDSIRTGFCIDVTPHRWIQSSPCE